MKKFGWFTPNDIMQLDPCSNYPYERVLELWAGRKALTTLEVAELDIPIQDRVWVLIQVPETRATILQRIVKRCIGVSLASNDTSSVFREWVGRWLDGSDRTLEAIEATDAHTITFLEHHAMQCAAYSQLQYCKISACACAADMLVEWHKERGYVFASVVDTQRVIDVEYSQQLTDCLECITNYSHQLRKERRSHESE